MSALANPFRIMGVPLVAPGILTANRHVGSLFVHVSIGVGLAAETMRAGFRPNRDTGMVHIGAEACERILLEQSLCANIEPQPCFAQVDLIARSQLRPAPDRRNRHCPPISKEARRVFAAVAE